MTDAEAIEILAAWVYTLRVDLTVAEQRANAYAGRADQLTRQLREQTDSNRELKRTLRGYTYWVQSGLTPREVLEAAQELDPAVVGAAA